MPPQQKTRKLNWLLPGRKEVTVVGSYVVDEASQMHNGFGGSSELDVEHVKFVPDYQQYSQLELALKDYIAETLRIQVTTFDDGLCEKITSMEKAYTKSKQGPWHRLWYGIGDGRKIAEAWMDVIPNEYGVAVVKTGVAVIFKLAENSKEKRQKVLKTFSSLRDTLLDLHPDRGRFQSDPNVRRSAEDSYKALVKAIEDMVLVLSVMETSLWNKFASKLKRGHKPDESQPTLDTILQTLEAQIKQYRDAIDLARDHTTERTEAYTRFNVVNTRIVDQKASYLVKRADEQRHHDAAMLKAMRVGEKELQQIAEGQVEIQAWLRTLMMRTIIDSEERKALEAEVASLRKHGSRGSRHTAVVSLAHLCSILAEPASAYKPHKPPDLGRMFQHPSADLRHALAEQSRFSARTQGQVQSLLAHEQFLAWMSRSRPSLVLVDANISESALDGLSAISVFCSTLVTSLVQAFPDTAVVVHFFCGMHASTTDAWYGPGGMVRSLIMQLLMKLDARDPEMKTWSLDFIDDRDFLQNLEEHSLVDLCQALHAVLYELPADTYVYIVVDSISCFDVGRLLKDLGTVMELLRNIVDDKRLVPVVKVLLTNPGESTRAITGLPLFTEDPARIITLSQHNLVPGEISPRAVDDHLLTAAPLMRARTPSPFRHDNHLLLPVSPARKTAVTPGPVVTTEVFDDEEMVGDDHMYRNDGHDDGHWS